MLSRFLGLVAPVRFEESVPPHVTPLAADERFLPKDALLGEPEFR